MEQEYLDAQLDHHSVIGDNPRDHLFILMTFIMHHCTSAL